MSIGKTTELTSVSSSQIVDGAVTSAKIAAGAVGSSALASSSVVAASIAAGAVGSAALADNAVVSSKINSGSATSGQILQANGSGGASFVTSESSKPYWLEISGQKAGTSLGIPNGPYAITNSGLATDITVSPSTSSTSFASGSSIRISATSEISNIGIVGGISWTNRSVTSATGTSSLSAIGVNSGTYLVAGGSGVFYSSTSPASTIPWTAITSGLNTTLVVNGAVYGSSTWVVGGRQSSYPYTAILATSTDLTSWTIRTHPFSTEALNHVIYGGTLFVAVGSGNDGVATSPDGTTWTARTSGFGGNIIYGAAYGNSKYFIFGEGRKYSTSTDGTTYTNASMTVLPTTNSETQTIYCAAFGNNTWVFGCGAGSIVTSPSSADTTFTLRTSGTVERIKAIVFDGTKFIYGAVGGELRTSTDGITWTARTSNAGSNNNINQFAYENGTYVGACGTGTIITSSNKSNIIAQPITYSSVT